MQLLYAETSPFVRKVMICAIVKDVMGNIEPTEINSSDAGGPQNDVNPLGKIPALTLDNDQVLYDSRVICEYLDSLEPRPKLFPNGIERWSMLTLAALADGICDAMVLTVYEQRLRPTNARHQPWIERQTGKIARAVAYLEANPKRLEGPLDYSQIAVACALGYLDLRGDGSWRHKSPKLVSWLDRFAATVPAFEQTKPPG